MSVPFALRALAATFLALVAAAAPVSAQAPVFLPVKAVKVTWHLPTGNLTYSGIKPFVGGAACSWDLPIGAVLVLADNRVVVCLDRGKLGADGWVDVYAPDPTFGREVERAYGGKSAAKVFLPAN
jgi:hypothetical protein